MRLSLTAVCLIMATGASAEWAPSLAKADAEARAKRRPVLIWVCAKDDPACARLEKEIWPVEPVKTRLRDFVAVKVELAALADAKTWEAVPRWKAQGEGAAAAPEVRILHPWGRELKRLPAELLKVPAEAGQALQAAFDDWEAVQGPIRADTTALDRALKSQDKDLMIECARKVIAHREPWTLPMLAACLYQPGVKIRETVIPELRRIDAEDGLQALLRWLKDQATTAGGDLAWREVEAANDPRTIPALKDNILNNSTQAVTRIRALGNFREKASIPFLIDLLPKVSATSRDPANPQVAANEAIQAEIASSLKKLTGQDLGTDHRKWKEWWKSMGPGFEFPK
ncbi:MAG: hypothetical protein HYY18_16040 [Planctomycetes bacterium]|nr:hypothetical protein [Planctomycetota bacterium]